MVAKHVVLAEYFMDEEHTRLFIVRDDFSVPVVHKVGVSFPAMRWFVQRTFSSTESHAASVERMEEADWQRLFAPLVTPLQKYVQEGDVIWFVPHSILHYVPLHALRLDDGRYLIERNPVCYTPSASVMQFCQHKRKGQRATALVLGDPRSNLLYASEEALIVADLFSTQAYLREQATKSLFKGLLEQRHDAFDVLHFACHGHFHPRLALQSGVELALESTVDSTTEFNTDPWTLTANEIFRLSMRAELVTLSACETGVNDQKPGDELIGLTRSLIYAGTPSVIVSLWSIDDLSSSLLMERFYRLWLATSPSEQPLTKAEALQQAQIYVMNLTAKDIIDYCNERLSQFDTSTAIERVLCYKLGLASAYLRAGDWQKTKDLWQELLPLIPERYAKLAKEIRGKRFLVRTKTTQDVDFTRKPFTEPANWAAFTLIGDWK